MAQEKTMYQKLREIVPTKIAYFVTWYCKEENERENFEEYSKRFLGNVTEETAMGYLEREDVQKAIKFWIGKDTTLDMIKLYKSMYEKAMKGDVQSANWVVKFVDSGFFKDKKDQLDELLNGVEIDE